MQALSVSILETDFRLKRGYNSVMKDWVVKAMNHAGLKQAEMTRQLHLQFGWSDNRSIFNKIVTGTRDLGAKEMYDIARLTKYPIPTDPLMNGQMAELAALLSAAELPDQEFAIQIAIDYLLKKRGS